MPMRSKEQRQLLFDERLIKWIFLKNFLRHEENLRDGYSTIGKVKKYCGSS